MRNSSVISRVGWSRLVGSLFAVAVLIAGFFVAQAQQDATGTPARPAGIHTGTCDSFEPTALYSLNDVMIGGDFDDDDDDDGLGSQGGRLGGTGAVPVAYSETEINTSIGSLTQQAHVVVVRDSSDNADQVLACGEIGGYAVDDDDLAFGLMERSGSGFHGIAILDDDDDDNEVEIHIYFASPGATIGSDTGSGAATGQQAPGTGDDDDDGFGDDDDGIADNDDGFDDDGFDDDDFDD